MLDILCELSAKQTIHIKCQALFSFKEKRDYSKMCSATNLGPVVQS